MPAERWDSRKYTARKPWKNPMRWEGVTCPKCGAPPGSICSGADVERFAHRERKDLARQNKEATP